MDTLIFRAVNDLVHVSSTLDAIGKFLSGNDQLLIEITAVACIAIGVLMQPRSIKNVTMAISTFISGLIMYGVSLTGFFLFFHRARPSVVLSSVNLLGKLPAAQLYASFPSAHAMFFFSIAGAIFYFNRKLGIAAAIVAALLSLSKLFVGVHWPSDLLVGAILGAALGLCVSWLLEIATEKCFRLIPKPNTLR